jgi:hypothetical protein
MDFFHGSVGLIGAISHFDAFLIAPPSPGEHWNRKTLLEEMLGGPQDARVIRVRKHYAWTQGTRDIVPSINYTGSVRVY